MEKPRHYTKFATTLKRAKEKVTEIHRRLTREYGTPDGPVLRDPLDELVFTILSQNTNDRNRDRAYASLRERYPDWLSVAAAPLSELAETIREGGLGPTKARYIKDVLGRVLKDRRRYDLGFLRGLSDAEALAYLLGLPGVGAKTAHCVLAFALGRDVFPVDTHILRVSKRLGLIPGNADLTKAHSLWAELAGAGTSYALHKNIIRHGRRVCHAKKPACDVCTIADLCPSSVRTKSRESGIKTPDEIKRKKEKINVQG